jgi:hypothetical protein
MMTMGQGTSEKNGDEPRAYSVRQYHPSRQHVDTIGAFNEMSRDQAHREAKKAFSDAYELQQEVCRVLGTEPAGETAIVVQEAHRKPSQAEQLAIDIKRGGGRADSLTAGHLIRMATQHQRMMVDYCNGVDIYDQDGEALPELAQLRRVIEAAAKGAGCGVVFSGDPRGSTVKLLLPSGETNSWGGEGWCVPTRE